MEASDPVEQCTIDIDPDIFNNEDVQNRSSFTGHNSSSLVSLEPQTANVSTAEKPSLTYQATGLPK